MSLRRDVLKSVAGERARLAGALQAALRGMVSAALLCSLLVVPAAPAAAQVPPDARWLAFESDHFRITFVDGLEEIARRAADRAEVAYAQLAAELVGPPRGRIELVITDHVDFSNGFATPFPTNRVVIFANPPVDEASLAFYDDWLQLLITHELVHIFHRDHARGVWRPLRLIFGRNPLLFPQIFAPGWVTEGLATYFESRLTQGGRVRGTLHDMALRTAMLEDRFFPIDRLAGDPVIWPGGSAKYIYGSLFLEHLSATYGPERVGQFVTEAGARLLPYRMDSVARRAFGVTFTSAWRAWEDSLRVHYAQVADSVAARGLTQPELLTDEGRFAFYPRYSPDGSAIVYARGTGREEPALQLLAADGTHRNIAPINSLAPPSWLPDGSGVLVGDLEHVDPYRTYADVYRIGLGGERQRLSTGARLQEISIHPQGDLVAGVENVGGTNVVAIRSLATGEMRRLSEPDLDVHWSAPRWDPGGTRLAVSRWSAGGFYDVVILDPRGTVLAETARDRAVDRTPAWSPDGRYVVFSSDRTGIPNLFAYEVETGRLLQATNLLTGALQPDVSPEGRWVVFALYRADGYVIARVPFDPAAWPAARPPRADLAEIPEGTWRYAATAGGPTRPYSPWPSVRPAAWSLTGDSGTRLGSGFGVSAWGEDVAQRHEWAADVLHFTRGSRTEWALDYRYAGLGTPVMLLQAWQDWSVRAAPGQLRDESGTPVESAQLRRDRSVGGSLAWQRRRVRSGTWTGVGGDVRDTELEWEDAALAGDRVIRQFPAEIGARWEVGYSTARAFSFTLGPRDGFSTVGRFEARRYLSALEGGDGPGPGYLRLTSRNRWFQGLELPGFADHVIALRADAGAETGSVSPGLRVGGAAGGAPPVPLSAAWLGRGLAFPVRGYAEGAQRGSVAFAASAEYRYPLALVERGYRLIPVFLSRVWGDLFVDAGAAWCPGRCELGFLDPPARPSPLVSAGAELHVDLDIGYMAGLPLRFGIAQPLSVADRRRPQFYVRIGRAF